MKLLRYGPKGKEKPGLLDKDGKIRDLSATIADVNPETLAPAALDRLRKLDPASLPLVSGTPRLGPCLTQIPKIVCVGLNYTDHAKETGAAIPKEPILFMKATSSLSGPNDDVMLPKGSEKTDWEVELGIVIGSLARHVSQSDARKHVRLLRRQRRLRARLPDRARRPVDQGQERRHVLPDGALAGHRRRGE